MKSTKVNKKFSIQKNIIQILTIIIFLFWVSQSSAFANRTLSSLCAILFFAIAVFALFSSFMSNKKISILFIVIVLFSAFSYLHGEGASLYEYLIILTGYIALPAYMIFAEKCEISSILNINFFRIFTVCASLFFIGLFFLSPNYSEYSGALTLGYSNPNTTGMFLFFCETMLILSFQNIKFIRKLFTIMIEIALLYLIYITQCRTALLLGFIFFILSLFPKVRRPKKLFVFLCVLSPLLFAAFYLILFNFLGINEFVFFGKKLFSGRQSLFSDGINFSFFGSINSSTPFGLNLFASVINVFGIVGYSILILFYYFALNGIFGKCEKRFKGFPMVCSCLVMVYGCTETAIFVNGSVFAAMFFLIILLSKYLDSFHKLNESQKSKML